MSTAVQRRRGTTAQHASFAGLEAEITVDTDKDTLVVHDGSTAGGRPLLREDGSNSALALGSAGTPSLKFTGDTSTGIYSPGTYQVAISTNGTGRLFVDSSGRVGIGAAPDTWYLDQVAPSNVLARFRTSGSGSAFIRITSADNNDAGIQLGGSTSPFHQQILGNDTDKNLRFVTNTQERLRITSNGDLNFKGAGTAGVTQAVSFNGSAPVNSLVIDSLGKVGVGTSSPSQKLTVKGIQSFEATNSTNGWYQYTHTDNTLRFNYNGSGGDEVTITSSGNVGIGTTSPNYILETAGDPAFIGVGTSVNGAINIIGRNSAGSGTAVAKIESEPSGATNASSLVFKSKNTSNQVLEGFRLDSSQRLLVGTSSNRTGANVQLQIEGTGYNSSSGSFVRNENGASGPSVILGKSRGGAVNSYTVVQSGDALGTVQFTGADGTTDIPAAYIQAFVDGTPGTNDMPGRLVFSTTSDSASSPTERVRITSTGRLMCGQDARNATLETDDQFVINGLGYTAYHALNATAYTIGQNSSSRELRIGSGSGWATTGVSLAAGGTSWGTYSDERLKTDIVELSDCLDSIKDIRCVSYRLTDVDIAESKKRLGIIAQDLVGKYDEAINKSRRSDDDETEYLSVQYTDLVPVLIKALQEASSKIETLEARLTALESA